MPGFSEQQHSSGCKRNTWHFSIVSVMISNKEHVLSQFLPPKKEDEGCVLKLIASSSLLKMTLILSLEFFTVHLTKIKYYFDIVTCRGEVAPLILLFKFQVSLRI